MQGLSYPLLHREILFLFPLTPGVFRVLLSNPNTLLSYNFYMNAILFLGENLMNTIFTISLQWMTIKNSIR